jgi:cytochrome c oxidase cbb3-type subunit IV
VITMELGNWGTAILVIVFIGIVAWVFSSKRKARWEEDAQIPFEDEAEDKKDQDSTRRNDP